MNWADWTIVGILSLSCLISVIRGFVKEALSLAVWVAAFIIAMVFDDQLAILLTNLIATPSLRSIVAFAILFVTTLIVGAMTNYLISELVKRTGLSGTDRMLGVIFGLARGALIVLAILIFLPSIVPVNEDDWWQSSQLIPHFLEFEDWAREATNLVTEWLFSFFE